MVGMMYESPKVKQLAYSQIVVSYAEMFTYAATVPENVRFRALNGSEPPFSGRMWRK